MITSYILDTYNNIDYVKVLQQNIRLCNNPICHSAVEYELHESFGWTNGPRSQYAFR